MKKKGSTSPKGGKKVGQTGRRSGFYFMVRNEVEIVANLLAFRHGRSLSTTGRRMAGSFRYLCFPTEVGTTPQKNLIVINFKTTNLFAF